MQGEDLQTSIPWGDQEEADGATVDFNAASGDATGEQQPQDGR